MSGSAAAVPADGFAVVVALGPRLVIVGRCDVLADRLAWSGQDLVRARECLSVALAGLPPVRRELAPGVLGVGGAEGR